MEAARRTGTVMKRSGARVFILEDSQDPNVAEKDLWFISARRFRDSADGWKVKAGDRVSFSPSNMVKRPNPVANDAYIIDPATGNPMAESASSDGISGSNNMSNPGSSSSSSRNASGDLPKLSGEEATARRPSADGVMRPLVDPAASSSAYVRRCPICVGVIASSSEEWEAHLAGEKHGRALRARASATATAPLSNNNNDNKAATSGIKTPGQQSIAGGPMRSVAPVAAGAAVAMTMTTTPPTSTAPLVQAPTMQSRFSFANQHSEESKAENSGPFLGAFTIGGKGPSAAPTSLALPTPIDGANNKVSPPLMGSSPVDAPSGWPNPTQSVTQPAAPALSANPAALATLSGGFVESSPASKPGTGLGVGQPLVLPRHSPDEPLRVTVAYRNHFVMEYEWPDVSVPVAVLRKPKSAEVMRRQWLVQRLEVVMGEMDEELPRGAFQNNATDWRETFLLRLEHHTGERWSWKKIDDELCLGEGKSSATFWRALRVGIQSSANAQHANVLVVKPANATNKMLFGKCQAADQPRSSEIPTHGKFTRFSFVRPELVYVHHHRLNNLMLQDEQGRELVISTEIDVPSLLPMWRLDWRSLMALPEPIFPGAIHVVGSTAEAPRAIEKLISSVSSDGLIGLWGEWSGDTKGHEYNRLQVIQLATERCSVVFKVGTWKQLPQAALDLFTHPRLRTVALGGQEITKKLRKDFRVDVTGGIDVLDIPAAQRCQPRSLKGLVGVFLHWNVGMDQAGSQWDAPRLTPGQLTHAATRPWLVLLLYRKILTIKYDAELGVVEGVVGMSTTSTGRLGVKRGAKRAADECHYSGWRPDSTDTVLDRVDAGAMSQANFWSGYVSARKPCVIVNAIPRSSDGLEWWSGEELSRQAGHVMVEVEVRESESEQFGQGKKTTMAFGDFLNKVPGQALMYMTTQSRVKGPISPPATSLVDRCFPRHIPFSGSLVLANLNMWLGASPRTKSTTPLHHDFHDNFYYLARGSKRFTLFAPSDAFRARTRGRVVKVHPNGLINYEGLPTNGDGSTELAIERVWRGKELRAAREDLARAEAAQDEEAMEKALDSLIAFTDGAEGWDYENNGEDEDDDHDDNDEVAEEESPLNHFCEMDATQAESTGMISVVVDLLPGEMLYLPCGWFHQVQSGDNMLVQVPNDFHLAVNWWYHPPDRFDNPLEPYTTEAWK